MRCRSPSPADQHAQVSRPISHGTRSWRCQAKQASFGWLHGEYECGIIAPVTSEQLVPVARATVWVIAGAPAAGKSTVAAALLSVLRPVPALLDKDVLFGGLVSEVLRAYGRPDMEREGAWYDAHVKVHEYRSMTKAARLIRGAGCPVMLDAPFTTEIRDEKRWRSWVEALGGDSVQLIWVRADPQQLYTRLVARGREWDLGKLNNFDEFISRMRPNDPPPVPHQEIDTRNSTLTILDQVTTLLRRIKEN
jgi:predicted kinase